MIRPEDFPTGHEYRSRKGGRLVKCPECGGEKLSWGQNSQARGTVPQGRLRTSDVQTMFFIGCDECSATVKVFTPDEMITLLELVTNERRRAGTQQAEIEQLKRTAESREEELGYLRALVERIDALFEDGEEATYSNPEGAYESVLVDMVTAFVHMVREARRRVRSGGDLDAVRRVLEPIGDEDSDTYSSRMADIRQIVFQGGQNGESVRRELIRLFTEEGL